MTDVIVPFSVYPWVITDYEFVYNGLDPNMNPMIIQNKLGIGNRRRSVIGHAKYI